MNRSFHLFRMASSTGAPEHANFAALSENEKVVISCLKNLVTDMEHFINLSPDVLCLGNCFTKSVTIWTEAVQKRMQSINDILKEFHDRSGSRICSADVIPAGNAEKQIARTLHLDIKTVRTIICKGIRKDKSFRKNSLAVDSISIQIIEM
jgi:hypothetical protein